MTSVLVVEDDAHMLEMILIVLRCEGYRVRGAVNGKEALVEMERSPADLVVLECQS
nr:response regulator [Paenibacillus sp. FSL H7-0331]